MYVGHFAIGLALKARYPRVPTLPIMLGAGFLDILDGIFIVLGWDRVAPKLLAGPYLFFDLTFIDWDHSLLAALFWSAMWGALFLRDRRVASLAFVASLSHFLADWPMHNNDLALYPYAETLKYVAGLNEPFAHLLHGILVTLGFLVPGTLMTWLVNKSESKATRRS